MYEKYFSNPDYYVIWNKSNPSTLYYSYGQFVPYAENGLTLPQNIIETLCETVGFPSAKVLDLKKETYDKDFMIRQNQRAEDISFDSDLIIAGCSRIVSQNGNNVFSDDEMDFLTIQFAVYIKDDSWVLFDASREWLYLCSSADSNASIYRAWCDELINRSSFLDGELKTEDVRIVYSNTSKDTKMLFAVEN